MSVYAHIETGDDLVNVRSSVHDTLGDEAAVV
jgi:hypothetical protein